MTQISHHVYFLDMNSLFLWSVHTINSMASYLLERIFNKPPVGIAHFAFMMNKVL